MKSTRFHVKFTAFEVNLIYITCPLLVLCESEQFFLNYQFNELGMKCGGFHIKSSGFHMKSTDLT